jgi:UDPglucose--hexose-1-phosphate uridylyltransferase
MATTINETSHRRYNILTGEWILVSPHRTKRPWQGKQEEKVVVDKIEYDENCYLCPGNERVGGEVNPDYKDTFIFKNDFAAILNDEPATFEKGLLKAEVETGICKVVCFSPNHSLTIPLMEEAAIVKVIKLWKKEYIELGAIEGVNYVQIFENKGAIMGCSNPHPHGQIWSQRSIPAEIAKKSKNQRAYFKANGVSLLEDYVKQELAGNRERVLAENDDFVALIAYWAVWPYEAMIVPKKHYQNISQLSESEMLSYALILKELTIMYDNLFEVSFPYSSGIHQSPTDDKDNEAWHFHMSFYPPLLRSATVKKFMVGYEMFASPQRDITAEQAALTLKSLPKGHYSK